MSRQVRDTNLERPTSRLRLEARGKPYWRLIEPGLHIGYRRARAGGGAWVGRRAIGLGKYAETRIGTADDLQPADGVSIVSFGQAIEAVRTWWKAANRDDLGVPAPSGPYTVSKALKDYFEHRENRGSKGVDKDRAMARVNIEPALGEIEVAKLTTKRIGDWLAALSKSGKRGRTAKAAPALAKPKPFDRTDPDAVRRRKATANRILTVLKAGLNHAFVEGRVPSDDAWRRVKPFREADAPVVQFLSEDECRRLVNAALGGFRDLVRGALLTGARYGELARMTVADFNPASATVLVRESKSGKPRHIALTDEGARLFSQLTAGRGRSEPIFRRDNGKPWAESHQQRPLDAACAAARIEPPATFHILRHTYASALAMRGVPMGVIAAQLGHADTRMTERHYAHLAPSYVADTVRAALPSLGIVDQEAGKIVAIRQ